MNEEEVCAVFIKVHSKLKHSTFQCLVNFKYAGHCFVFVSENLMIFEFALDGSSGDVSWF